MLGDTAELAIRDVGVANRVEERGFAVVNVTHHRDYRRPRDHLARDYFLALFRPYSLPNAGTEQMQAAMEKYAGFTKTQFPTFSQYEAWAGADLMIKGLGLAGTSPTRASTIKALRGITSYNANGLLPNTFDYSTNFGHNPAKTCAWVMQAKTNGFTAISATPTCGTDLPHTSTASSS